LCSKTHAAHRLRIGALAISCSIAVGALAQESRLEAECHSLLRRYVFNCGCTTEFLDRHMSPEQAEILLKLWVHGANGDSQRSEMLDLYLQHGAKTVSEAVMNFHRHRDLLRRYCAQGDGPTISD
jgi:hypothetical protein